MCNFIIKKQHEENRKCKLQPNKNFCFIHKYKEPLIISVDTSQLEDKTKAINSVKIQLTHLYNVLEKRNNTIKELIKDRKLSEIKYNENLNLLQKQNNNMKEDYNNFQVIKEYERIKHNLLKKNIDILNFKNAEFHRLRLDRNFIVHEKVLERAPEDSEVRPRVGAT